LEPQRFDTLLPAARAASGQQALLGRFADSALGSARNASDSLEQDFLTVLFYFHYQLPEITRNQWWAHADSTLHSPLNPQLFSQRYQRYSQKTPPIRPVWHHWVMSKLLPKVIP
jgi:hypothetical protein